MARTESHEPTRDAAAFLAVFFLALAVRAAYLFLLAPNAARLFPGLASTVGTAFDGYRDIAIQVIQGHGFAFDGTSGPTAARAPLYPLFLAALFRLFGTGVGPVLWAHAILGAATCGLVFIVGRRMFDRKVGWLGGVLLALYPPHVWWSQYVLSETLLVFLIVATFFALLVLFQDPTIRRALAAGAVFALTALCNSMILYLPPLLLLAAASSRERRQRYLRHALVMVAAMWLVIAPWTVRNAATFHRFIPVNWSIGWVYLKGLIMTDDYIAGRARDLGKLDDDATDEIIRILRSHGFTRLSEDEKRRAIRRTMCVDLEEDQFLKQQTRERLRANPFLALRKLAANLVLYWFLSIRFSWALMLMNFTLLGLALVGLARGAWRSHEARLMVLFGAYLYLSYAAVIVSARFALQVIPFVALLAAFSIRSLARRASQGPRP